MSLVSGAFGAEVHRKTPSESKVNQDSSPRQKYYYSCEGTKVLVSLCENEFKLQINSVKDCQNAVGGLPLVKEYDINEFNAGVLTALKIKEAEPTEGELENIEKFVRELNYGKDNPRTSDLAFLKRSLNPGASSRAPASESTIPVSRINKGLEQVKADICVSDFNEYINKSVDNNLFAELVDPDGFRGKECGEGLDKEASSNNKQRPCEIYRRIDKRLKTELVSRVKNQDGTFSEYWKVPSSQGKSLLWSPIAEKKMTPREALIFCSSKKDFGKTWTLPTKKTFLEAMGNYEVDTNVNFFRAMDDSHDYANPKYFWTSTPAGSGKSYAIKGGNGDPQSPSGGRMGADSIYNLQSVRCVADAN